jgi:hypothetical protein
MIQEKKQGSYALEKGQCMLYKTKVEAAEL